MWKNIQLNVILTILLASSSLQAPDLPDEFKEICAKVHAACVAETGVSNAAIEAAGKGDFMDDQPLKCFLKCVWNFLGLMDDDGIVDVETMKAALPPKFSQKVSATLDKCGTKIGSDPCDNAFLTNKCYYENSPDDFFVI